jgi:hypothetical protein
MTRRTLQEYGTHGKRARVYVEGGRVVVSWYQDGNRRQESRTDSPEARAELKALGQSVAATLAQRETVARSLSVRELFVRYLESRTDLRPRSIRIRRDYWRKWELLVGADTRADDLTAEALDRLRLGMQKAKLAPSTIGQAISTVKLIYAWGEELGLVHDRLHRYRYRVAKEDRRASPAEYSGEQFAALVAAIDPRKSWRALGVLMLCGLQGSRQWAVLHLRKDDLDLVGPEAPRIRWRAQWDKQGREEWQPLRPKSLVVLQAILDAHQRLGIDSPYLFPAGNRLNKGKVYTEGAVWRAIIAAETKAGIPHARGRASHGLRRLLAGDVYAITKDVKLAMEAIRDTDLRTMIRYLKKREGQLTTAFTLLDNPGGTDGGRPAAEGRQLPGDDAPSGRGGEVSDVQGEAGPALRGGQLEEAQPVQARRHQDAPHPAQPLARGAAE